MQPQKPVRDRDFYSLLFDFCQQQGLDIDRNSFNNALGKLVFSDGEIYTIEEIDVGNQKYRLRPLAIARINELALLNERDIKRIADLDGNDLEYIALNTHMFPVLGDKYWENWSPLNRQDGHEEIYRRILDTLGNYVSGGKILVIGCGDGSFLEILTQQGYNAIGIDSNKINVEIAISKGRNVQQRRIEEFDGQFDVVIDPGVLSAGVVERSYVETVLPRISAMIRQGGYLIHAPFSRSLFTSEDLERSGLAVCSMTVPTNLFSYELPKQFYVGQKEPVPRPVTQ